MDNRVAIIVSLIIIAIIAYVGYTFSKQLPTVPIIITHNGGTSTTTISSTTSNTPSNTVKTSNTTTSNTITNSTTPPPKNTTNSTSLNSCIGKPSGFQNGNFATGTYAGWNVTGQGFGTAPTNITYANNGGGYYEAPWSGYNGNFFATTYRGGLVENPGNLTSSTFLATEPYLNFQIVSGSSSLLYVELLQNNRPFFTAHFTTTAATNSSGQQTPYSQFVNASIPLISHICQNVNVRVVSGVVATIATENQYIAVGGFHVSSSYDQTPGILVNSS